MIVLGIDPGIASCGFALVGKHAGEAPVVLDLGVWETDSTQTLRARCAEYLRDLGAYIRDHAPQVVVAEVPSFPRSAKAAHMLGLAYGALGGLCYGRALLVERTGREWRRLVGLSAKADGDTPKAARAARKASTADLMRRRFPGVDRLLPAKTTLHEHALDALAISTSWTDHAGGEQPQASTEA